MTNDLKTLEEREKNLEEQRSQLKAKIDQSAYIASRRLMRKRIKFLHEIMTQPESTTYHCINQIFWYYENVSRQYKTKKQHEKRPR